jgi:signal transduction histidine kinase
MSMAARRGWRRWTLARRLRAALLALSVLMLLSGLVLVGVLREADRALSNQTERTFPARLAASRLMTSLVDQETALRGYALTGDERFLEPYRRGLVDEQSVRAQLDDYVPPGDPARLRLLTVDAAITAWRDQYASLRIGDTPGAGADSTIQFGRELFNRVRRTNAALDAALAREVAAARAEAERDRRLVAVAIAVMAAATVAAVIGLQRALKTMVLGPLTRLGAQVAVVSHGDHEAPIRPEGPPDISEMAAGVESMRLELLGVLAELDHERLAVEQRAAELARSNADLEQFAYVASHDLQEPLRKVASFCQLLEQRYRGQLDERADQYIAFAVDGAKRMQLLINDLLTFSRVGRTSASFAAVDLATIVRRSWSTLEARVQESGGQLETVLEGCPRAFGDPALLQMLFDNVIGNALKYRRPDRFPIVRVSATQEAAMLRVDVADNGIGIPQEYAEKVFVIFQRLHGRDEYEGTGIGLALAKKVVEFHGGTIEAGASGDGGTCMSFTLPLEESPAHA